MKYIDLHLHTKYTKGNGISEIKGVVKRAREFSMDALAITDSGSISGFDEFNRECIDKGIKPIFGCGFYFAPMGLLDETTHHLVLIAMSNKGLDNLKRLSYFSFNKGMGSKPRIDFNILEERNHDLICLTGGLGGVYDKPYLLGDKELADGNLIRLKEIFNSRLYLELQDNELDNNKKMANVLTKLSKELSIPLVVTGGSFYLNREDSVLCNKIRSKHGNRELKGSGYFFKSMPDIIINFNNIEAIENSYFISSICNVKY